MRPSLDGKIVVVLASPLLEQQEKGSVDGLADATLAAGRSDGAGDKAASVAGARGGGRESDGCQAAGQRVLSSSPSNCPLTRAGARNTHGAHARASCRR